MTLPPQKSLEDLCHDLAAMLRDEAQGLHAVVSCLRGHKHWNYVERVSKLIGSLEGAADALELWPMHFSDD